MASTKKFADMRKPGRRPTLEEIAAFEETGRAVRPPKAGNRKPANTEISVAGNTESREHGNTSLLEDADTDSRKAAKAESSKSVNTETRVSGSVVRLTIDLPETVHTRFKTACAMTKRKMVDEVRAFIEQRAAELEGEAGRAV